MGINRQIRGPYICYGLDGEFSAGHIVKFKALITDDLKDHENDIAIDLRGLRYIDSSGLKLFKNLKEALSKDFRRLVLFGGTQDIRSSFLQSANFESFESVNEFERNFHEMNPELHQTLLKLAKGKGPLKSLKMICPLCGCDSVNGYILDTNKYQLEWSDSEITPVWEPISDETDYFDYNLYQVAVCHECHFASSRPDWFHIQFPEGKVDSSLKDEQIESLKNVSAQRRNLVAQWEDQLGKSFFEKTREPIAGYVCWLLNEFTHKNLTQDRHQTDGFEIAESNFMLCKYTYEQSMIDDHLNSAMAWLNSILNNRSWYSTLRIAKTFTYMVSVYLAWEKSREARQSYEEMEKLFGKETGFDFWMKRAKILIMEDMDT